MNKNMTDQLNELSFNEIDEVMEYLKEKKKEKREEFINKNRVKLRDVQEGDSVYVIFKGEEVEASFVKVTEKRFSVIIDGQKKSIMFDKLTGIDGMPV
jgi:hypothetical protein